MLVLNSRYVTGTDQIFQTIPLSDANILAYKDYGSLAV